MVGQNGLLYPTYRNVHRHFFLCESHLLSSHFFVSLPPAVVVSQFWVTYQALLPPLPTAVRALHFFIASKTSVALSPVVDSRQCRS